MMQDHETYKSTHERLSAEGYSPDQKLEVRSMVSTAEKGKKYMLEINGMKESVVYAVDGNIVKNGQRCDKLVLVKRSEKGIEREQWTEIFVELKGRDTGHAIDQLRDTLAIPIFKHQSNDVVRARIVAQSFPSNKSNPTMEKAKLEFRKNYHCDLRGMKTGQKDRL